MDKFHKKNEAREIHALVFDRRTSSRRGLGAKLFLIMLLTVATQFAFSQTIKVSGKVADDKGNALYGVGVMVKGTSQGTTTDANGAYTINVSGTGVLEFSYVGYIAQTQEVKSRININVFMREDAQQLDEVVVVGYGTQRKRDLTGAVVSVGSDKIKERSYSNVMQSLAGQLPGVQVTQSQGSPGFAPTIKVRGNSSITSGTTPLYVIDGIPLEDGTSSSGSNGSGDLQFNNNPMNNINPQDIESIEILKDASSAAIYGSRGANGVVIITTKQGKAGKTKIEASYEFGISNVDRRIDVMDAKEWMAFETAARNNSWATILQDKPNAVRGTNTIIPVEFSDPAWLERIGNGTDWQDVLFRTGTTHNVQASASGGSEKTQFMISGGYLNTKGVVDNNDYDRITLRSNIRHKISDHFNVGLNVSLARSNAAEFGNAGKSDVVSLSAQSVPIFPLYVETGSLGFKDPNSIWNTFQKYSFQLWHPYSLTREQTKNKLTNNTQAMGFVEWNIIDGLSFKTSLSANIDDVHYSSYWNEGQNWGYSGWVNAEGVATTRQMFNWVWENTLNYNKTFGDHAVTGLLGYTAQEQRIDNSNMKAGSFPNDMVHTLNAGKVTNGSTDATEWSLLSYLARATYSFKGKYLFSAAVRADGCSRFGANNRWGYFPSASVGWRLSEESFMRDATWIDNLKLRASYGVTGNNQIPNYGAIGLLGYASYPIGDVVTPGIYTNTFPDKNLKWEKTSQVNIGFDASILNQRINISYDYYHSTTNDLLLNIPIPVISGFKSTLTNIGKMQNQGMELTISTRNLIGKFNWTTDFNISGNRNKILALGNNDAPFNVSFNDALVRFEVGQPMSNYYGYIFDGVIMSEADLSKYPVWKGSEAGDPKIRDVNGVDEEGNLTGRPDGIIDEKDQTIIGNYQPDFTWGMTNSFSYKGIDLSFMLTGSQGGEIMNQHSRFLKSFNGDRNAYKQVNNFWKSESDPGNGQIHKPRVIQNTVQAKSSTYWVEDGSFVRIKNIRLGYTLPKKFTDKIGIASAKIYVNVENVYVFSDYSNYDPEGSTFQTGAYVGLDYGAYPNPRVCTMGVNFNF